MAYGSNHPIKETKIDNPDEVMREYKRTGNPELRNQLIMHYIKNVNSAIYSMKSILISNVPFDDFFNQGVVALMESIERYDPTREASFDTYSYMGIRGAILKYLRKQHWLPNRLWEARKKISVTRKKLEQTLMREPTETELAKALGISEQKLSKYMLEIASVETYSFEEFLEQTFEKASMIKQHSSDEMVEDRLIEEEMLSVLADAIDSLKPKQKQIITLYYYEGLNLREIGEILDISQQRVSQIRISALSHLKKAMKNYEKGLPNLINNDQIIY